MSTAQQDRELLKTAYQRDGKPSRKWVMKVNRMPDAQVFVILKRLKSQGAV